MFSAPVRSLAYLTAALAVGATVLAVSGSRPATAAAPSPAAETPRDENPRVKPGLVNWHGTAAEARAASERSGRPVLVFHMMGQLDKQFC